MDGLRKLEIEALLADLERERGDVTALKRIDREWLAAILRDLLAEVESLHEDLQVAGKTVAQYKAIAQPLVEQYHLPIRVGEDWIKVALTELANEAERLRNVLQTIAIAENVTEWVREQKAQGNDLLSDDWYIHKAREALDAEVDEF